MKKILICGVAHIELRRKVEYFLDDDHEIIGYTDTSYSYDVLDGKRFFSPAKLSSLEFDYVLLCAPQEASRESMRRSLAKMGIPAEKMIVPTIFLKHYAEAHQLDLVADIREHRDDATGLIFGLSYSLRGIIKEMLPSPFYDCSWHGLDLYYNYRLYLYILEHGYFPRADTVLMVFPYYYFDYDMSRSLYQYQSGQIFSVRQLDDWHNFKAVSAGAEYIANYRIFGHKFAQFYHFHRFQILNAATYQGSDGTESLSNIWFSDNRETQSENKELLSQFLQRLYSKEGRSERRKVILIVPPYNLSSFNQESMDAFREKRERFYSILQEIGVIECGVKIFDWADIFPDHRELFYDTTHLNAAGAKAFTELIIQTILTQ